MPTCHAHRRHGFTLVEILVATALTAGLLAGLWTMLGIFSSLQTRAASRTARAQIVRGFIRQFQDDLNRVVLPSRQPPHAREPASIFDRTEDASRDSAPVGLGFSDSALSDSALSDSALSDSAFSDSVSDTTASQSLPTNVGAVSLLGAGNWIVMDLARTDWDSVREFPSVGQEPNGSVVDTSTGYPSSGATQSRLNESYTRVIYYFVSPELAIVEESLAAGLTRWEIPSSVSINELSAELNDGKFGTPGSRLWEQVPQFNDSAHTFNDSLASNPTQITGEPANEFDVPREPIPEIERLLFRFYGESGWSPYWDSRSQNGEPPSLPTAIECLVIWRYPNEVQTGLHSHIDSTTDPTSGTNGVTNRERRLGQSALRNSDNDKEQDEIRLLAIWERLGDQEFTASASELPPGFARYVFSVSAANVPQRTLPDMLSTEASNLIGAANKLSGGL